MPSVLGSGSPLPCRTIRVHLAAHVLGPSMLAYGLSHSPAGMLAWVLERWVNWSDNGGDVETVFTKDDLCTRATIFWATNTIATSIRTYANNHRYSWIPSHDRRPPIEAPTGITFVGYENPPGVRTDQHVQHLLESDRRLVQPRRPHRPRPRRPLHPWELPDQWVDDLRRTFRAAAEGG
jgi:hypothetical protein